MWRKQANRWVILAVAALALSCGRPVWSADNGPKGRPAAKSVAPKAERDTGHDAVSNSGTENPGKGENVRTEGDDRADADDVVSSSGPEATTEVGAGEAEEAGFTGDMDAGEIELVGQVLQAIATEEAEDESADRFAEFQAILPDAERFSVAEYAAFMALPTMDTLEFGAEETVCGPDNRVRITQTTKAPWRWNCQLIMTLANGAKARCTGWFIGPHTVMTAGHCVYSKSAGGWAKSIDVIPGMDGPNKPFGTFKSTKLFSVKGWTNGGDTNYDYGAIHINSQIGNKLGWYGFVNLAASELKGLVVNIAGYPGDKPFGTQWYHWGPIVDVLARKIKYNIDTYPGQSGSAVYRVKGGNRQAVAVHTNGGCPNAGTRIIEPVAKNMKAWKK